MRTQTAGLDGSRSWGPHRLGNVLRVTLGYPGKLCVCHAGGLGHFLLSRVGVFPFMPTARLGLSLSLISALSRE